MNLHVAYASDDNYIKHMMISIFSLLENNIDHFDNIRISVLDPGLSNTSISQLQEFISNYPNCSIDIIDISKELSILDDRVKVNLSLCTFGRYWIDKIENISSRIIYLDCDTIITRPFVDLLTVDIGDNYIAGVWDVFADRVNTSIGASPNTIYVNAGFLLIDTNKWISNHVSEKLLAFTIKNPDKLEFADQNVINIVLKDKIFILPLSYNCPYDKNIFTLAKLKYDHNNYWSSRYDINEYMEAYEFPHIVHYYLHYFKPWHSQLCANKIDNSLYNKYKARSPLAKIPPDSVARLRQVKALAHVYTPPHLSTLISKLLNIFR